MFNSLHHGLATQRDVKLTQEKLFWQTCCSAGGQLYKHEFGQLLSLRCCFGHPHTATETDYDDKVTVFWSLVELTDPDSTVPGSFRKGDDNFCLTGCGYMQLNSDTIYSDKASDSKDKGSVLQNFPIHPTSDTSHKPRLLFALLT